MSGWAMKRVYLLREETPDTFMWLVRDAEGAKDRRAKISDTKPCNMMFTQAGSESDYCSAYETFNV